MMPHFLLAVAIYLRELLIREQSVYASLGYGVDGHSLPARKARIFLFRKRGKRHAVIIVIYEGVCMLCIFPLSFLGLR